MPYSSAFSAAASRSSGLSAGSSTSVSRSVAISLNASSRSGSAMSAPRTLGLLSLTAAFSVASRVPWRWSRSAAVFSPMPLAPGRPSLGSPRSAMKSGTWPGSTP